MQIASFYSTAKLTGLTDHYQQAQGTENTDKIAPVAKTYTNTAISGDTLQVSKEAIEAFTKEQTVKSSLRSSYVELYNQLRSEESVSAFNEILSYAGYGFNEIKHNNGKFVTFDGRDLWEVTEKKYKALEVARQQTANVIQEFDAMHEFDTNQAENMTQAFGAQNMVTQNAPLEQVQNMSAEQMQGVYQMYNAVQAPNYTESQITNQVQETRLDELKKVYDQHAKYNPFGDVESMINDKILGLYRMDMQTMDSRIGVEAFEKMQEQLDAKARQAQNSDEGINRFGWQSPAALLGNNYRRQ